MGETRFCLKIDESSKAIAVKELTGLKKWKEAELCPSTIAGILYFFFLEKHIVVFTLNLGTEYMYKGSVPYKISSFFVLAIC